MLLRLPRLPCLLGLLGVLALQVQPPRALEDCIVKAGRRPVAAEQLFSRHSAHDFYNGELPSG